MQTNQSYTWQDKIPASYFQWNIWHFPHNVRVHYELEQNPYLHEKWMNNFAHWNRKANNAANDTCGEFTISDELVQIQPSGKSNYKCVASVLGDMRHSDWIMVLYSFYCVYKFIQV